jgi:lipopolysaccharide assembly protein A
VKYLMWLLNAAIFVLLFAFALNNQASVTVHLLFGAQWQVPMVLALFIALLLGVCLGVFVMLPLWLRARKSDTKPAKVKKPAAKEPTASPALDASTSASPPL